MHGSTTRWQHFPMVPMLLHTSNNSISHTIRPNGQILEGNPARPGQASLFVRHRKILSLAFAGLVMAAQMTLLDATLAPTPASAPATTPEESGANPVT